MQISVFSVVYGLLFVSGNQLTTDTLPGSGGMKLDTLSLYNSRFQVGVDLLGVGKYISSWSSTESSFIKQPYRIFFKHPVSGLFSLRYEMQYSGFDRFENYKLNTYRFLDSIPPSSERVPLRFYGNGLVRQQDYEARVILQSNFMSEIPFIGFGLGFLIGKSDELYSGYHEILVVSNNPHPQVMDNEYYYTFSDIEIIKTGFIVNVNFSYRITKWLGIISDISFNYIINSCKQKNFNSFNSQVDHLKYSFDELKVWFMRPSLVFSF